MKSASVAALLLLAACASARPDSDEVPPPALQAAPTPTDPRVSELQVVVGELLDRVEVLNARIAKLESETAGAAAPSVSPRATKVAATAAPAVAAEPPAPPVAATAKPSAAPAERVPAPVPQATRPSTAGGAIAESYRNALELYGKGRIDDARTAFQAVYDADPAGDLADNALFWIGETFFSTGKYNDAVGFYTRVTTDYGDGNKAPDAMLKIGMSQAKLGDLDLARRTFDALVNKYPYSTAAAAAKYELKRIRY